jgi:hypothetical protein
MLKGYNIKNFCLKEFWRTERACQDAEAFPLPEKRNRFRGKKAGEALKVQSVVLHVAS